ncbi:type VII secretion integral membrane protein EccD [Actinomadura sp. DC4]|uniref:type VII secretion integral membrane protein EccD n=1 Tax=Actinomadura sp. DC4 TaxID=3055069 RepID=UPI0025B07BB2|nr:type VII secretion integral membrane protein EccD [Actinomadura sp. DC4]MDN3354775.1 type VII secretion integral membrane protein EccD [Actinomadura sp. DC4]
MTTTTSDACRLTVVAPSGWIELAVPSDIAIADLLPALVQQAGEHAAEEGLEHSGWVLQRLGEEPLDEDLTPAALGLLDGDTLYLRPRDRALAVLEFDDVVDGVSAGVRNRPSRWRDAATRWLFLGLTGVTLAIALAVLLFGGATLHLRVVSSVLVELLLLVAAASMSRAFADTSAGTVLGLAALPYAALSGVLAVDLVGPATGLGAPHLLAAAAATAGAAFIALLAVGASAPLFLFAGGTALAGTAGAAMPVVSGMDGAQAAAFIATVVLMLAPSVPVTAFRLARMRLPILPRTPEELQQDLDPIASDALLDRAGVADQYVTALFGGVGAVCAGSLTVLAPGHGWEAPAMALAISVALLLRSRVMAGAWARVTAVAPACYGAGLYVVARVHANPRLTDVVLVLLVALAGLLLVGARRMPGKRLLPYWGRAADLAESAVSIALPVLLLAVLHAYGFARSFSD